MVIRILATHNCVNSTSKIFQRLIQFVCTSQIFKMTPKTFDRVQGWAVFRQPEHPDSGLEKAQGCLDSFATMIGGIIHNENDFLGGEALHQHVL